MRVLGVKSVKVTNARGFCLEISTAITVVLASRYGAAPLGYISRHQPPPHQRSLLLTISASCVGGVFFYRALSQVGQSGTHAIVR